MRRAIGSVSTICQQLGALGGPALEYRRLPVAAALLGAVSDSAGGPEADEGSAGQGSGGGSSSQLRDESTAALSSNHRQAGSLGDGPVQVSFSSGLRTRYLQPLPRCFMMDLF